MRVKKEIYCVENGYEIDKGGFTKKERKGMFAHGQMSYKTAMCASVLYV